MDDFKQVECCICTDVFKKGEKVKKVPLCRHIFHSPCIDNWFKIKIEQEIQRCPLCNTEITVDKIKAYKSLKKEERK